MQYHDNDPNNADIETMFGTHEELTADAIIDEAETDFAADFAADYIEDDVAALLNIADSVGALQEWLETNTELTDNTYARRLSEVARFFDMCSDYHAKRGDYTTAEVYAHAQTLRDLAHGLTHGGQMRETVVNNLRNIRQAIKIKVKNARK